VSYESGAYGRGWSKLRRQVLDRDGYVCRWCGVELRRPGGQYGAPATVDHLFAVGELKAVGERVDPASVHPDDLVSSCRDCNHRRGQKTRSKLSGKESGPVRPGPARPTSKRSPWDLEESETSVREPGIASLETLRGDS
jgi:5-methylcytosine-specific restriction endonuclease McrA